MIGLLKRVVRWTAGLVLVMTGLVLSIPGVPGPGILVALIGILVLLPESRWLRKRYARLKRRHPRLFGPLERYRRRRRHRATR
jgi:hypothetical protein